MENPSIDLEDIQNFIKSLNKPINNPLYINNFSTILINFMENYNKFNYPFIITFDKSPTNLNQILSSVILKWKPINKIKYVLKNLSKDLFINVHLEDFIKYLLPRLHWNLTFNWKIGTNLSLIVKDISIFKQEKRKLIYDFENLEYFNNNIKNFFKNYNKKMSKWFGKLPFFCGPDENCLISKLVENNIQEIKIDFIINDKCIIKIDDVNTGDQIFYIRLLTDDENSDELMINNNNNFIKEIITLKE